MCPEINATLVSLVSYTCCCCCFAAGSQPRKQTACGCGCHLRLAIGSQVAAEIRQALAEELSITCCAGIAHNKLLAKLVGSVHKPNKQTTLFPEDVPTFMVSLSNIRAIPGDRP